MLCQEAKQIATGNQATLKIGVLRSLSSDPLLQTLESFSKDYPQVSIELNSGNLEELFEWLRNEKVDLVLSGQRRAFSEEYINLILGHTFLQLEIAKHHPLALYESIEIHTLKNFSCLLISSPSQHNQEQDYFQSVIGFSTAFRFASSLEEAKWTLLSSQSVWPRFSFEPLSPFTKRIALIRQNQPIFQTLCPFWKKDNSGYYVEEFAEHLKAHYDPFNLDFPPLDEEENLKFA